MGPFCAACGQKSVPLSVTLHEFFHDLTHEVLHVDGRILQSVQRLMLSPGFLTREYLQGRRARWISPIRLYIVCSVIFFGLSALTGFRVGVNTAQRGAGWNYSLGNAPQVSAGMDDDEAKDLGFENAAAMQAAVNQAMLVWSPRVMFVLLPLFAGLVALAYRRVDSNYIHHLIFAVHVHAAWFAASALGKAVELASQPLGQALQQIAILFAAVYVVLALRVVYGKVRFGFARIVLVLMAYTVAFIAAMVTIVLPVIFRQVLTKPT
jgi:hypothetical protein